MSGKWRIACSKCGHKIAWSGTISERPLCPKCNPPDGEDYGDVTDDVADALCQCREIIRLTDELEENPRAIEFAESIGDKVRGIHEWISENGAVTENQRIALDNMESGVRKWFR